MAHTRTLKDALGDDCPTDFENLEVIYENEWQSWEESGCIVLFKFFDSIQCLEWGHSVMASVEDNRFYFSPREISFEEAKDIIQEWDNIDKDSFFS